MGHVDATCVHMGLTAGHGPCGSVRPREVQERGQGLPEGRLFACFALSPRDVTSLKQLMVRCLAVADSECVAGAGGGSARRAAQ